MKTLLPVAILVWGLLIAIETAFAQTWTQTSATNVEWSSIASSADGTRLAAVASANGSGTGPGGIYTSTNSGITWIQSTNGDWLGIASSADGVKLVAVANGSIMTSTNSGLTWTNVNAPSVWWRSVASSADGSKLLATTYLQGGDIYVSTNSGTSWRLATNAGAYGVETACSADGTRMAVEGGYGVLTSTNTGTTWRLAFPHSEYFGLASSADGNKLFVITFSGEPSTDLHVSTNWGATWSSNFISVPEGSALASSADGSKLVAIGDFASSIYTSTDSGVTWISNNAPNEAWNVVVSSADGTKLVTITQPLSSPGGIWTSQSVPAPELNLTPFNADLALSWIVPSTNFVLQQTSDLTTTNWVTLTNTPTLNLSNLNDEVALSPSNGSGFFRLIAQ